jgi:hypothetical protein
MGLASIPLGVCFSPSELFIKDEGMLCFSGVIHISLKVELAEPPSFTGSPLGQTEKKQDLHEQQPVEDNDKQDDLLKALKVPLILINFLILPSQQHLSNHSPLERGKSSSNSLQLV